MVIFLFWLTDGDEWFSTVEGWSNPGDGVGYSYELKAAATWYIKSVAQVVTVTANRGRQKFSAAGLVIILPFRTTLLDSPVTYEVPSLVYLSPFPLLHLAGGPVLHLGLPFPRVPTSHMYDKQTDGTTYLGLSQFFLMISTLLIPLFQQFNTYQISLASSPHSTLFRSRGPQAALPCMFQMNDSN